MKKGSLWYSANEDQVNVVRSFGWHCHGLQPGQPITYEIQPDIDRPSTFRWAKTTWEKDENGWYLAGTDLRGEELNGTIIDIDEL